jgi:hypothetical protein
MASGTTVQGGTLTFNFGTVTNGTFSADTTHAASTVTIPDGASLTATASHQQRRHGRDRLCRHQCQRLAVGDEGHTGRRQRFHHHRQRHRHDRHHQPVELAYDPSATGGIR